MEPKRRIPFILILLCLLWDQVLPQENDDITDPDGFDLSDECGSNPMDLVLLVDTSNASNVDYDREVRNFLSEFVEYADVNSGAVRVALVTFSTGVQIEFKLGDINNIAGIQRRIRNVPFTPGDRNTADALEMLRRGIFFEPFGDRPDAPDVLIIITTGNANRNIGRTVPQAEALHQGGVNILVIGIGVKNEEETNGMASSPANENTFYLTSVDELSIIKDLVFVQLCTPLMTENIPEISQAGDVLDLIFLFHFSNEISEEDFRYILSYVSGLLIGADTDSGRVRVGAALYRHDGVPIFQLNQYQRKEDIIDAIEKIPYNYRSARASLSAGIETVRTNMFQRQAGDRDEAPNGLILITDSTSNINRHDVAQEAAALHNSGVTVFSIGIGLRSTDEVRSVASSNDKTYLLRTVTQLPALTGQLQDRIPALKTVLPQPTDPPTPEPTTEPEPEPTKPVPEVVTATEPATIENSDIADILVVFHSSHKTKARDFNRNLKTFMSDIFSKARIEPDKVRVALVNYGSRANPLFNFNTHTTKPKARGAIRKLKAKLRSSRSNLAATLRHIRNNEFSQAAGSRISDGVPGVVILITDMPADRSAVTAQDEAALLKRSGVSILTVGIGKADQAELSAIASQPRYAQYVPDYATLKRNADILGNIKNTVYALQGPKARKPQPTVVVVTTAQPETTLAPERVTQISNPKLAILFHASSSTSARDYNKRFLVFMSSLLEDNRLDLTKFDVGVFNFGKEPRTLFNFGTHRNRQDIQSSILKIPKSFRSTSSNLGKTLKMLVETNDVIGSLPNHILIISDTPSVGLQNEANRYLQQLKSSGAKIHFIGISYPYDAPIQSYTSEPHDQYFHTVENYESLLNAEDLKRNFVAKLLEDMNSSINVHRSITTEMLATEHVTELYETTVVQGPEKTYLAIVFQSSSTTSPKDYFKNLLVFMSKLVSEDHFNSSTLDVALINYGKTTRVLFNFNTHGDLSSAKAAILNSPKTLRSKKANIGETLQILNREIFNTSARHYGGRGHVILLADKAFGASPVNIPAEAQLLINSGIRIHSIGITSKTINDLRTVSSKPLSSYFQTVGNYAELNQNPGVLQQVITSVISSPELGTSVTTTIPTTESTKIVVSRTEAINDDGVIHTAILFQSSSSTSPMDFFRHLLVFLSDIADEQHFTSNRANFAFINYGKKNRVLFNFNTYRDISDVKSAILRTPKTLRSKKSNIGEALKILNTDIFNTSERNYGGKGHLVLLSDKIFDVTRVNALEEAKLLRNSGVRIHTIGITDKPLEDFEEIVSWPLDNYFQTVESYPELIQNPSVLEHLVENIKSSPMDPRLTTLPTPSSTTSTSDIKKVPDPTEADIVLVFHASDTVKKADYKKKLLKFMFKLVKKSNIDKGKVRVALVNFGDDAQTIFDLTQYKTKKSVIKAIKKTPKNLKFKNAELGKALRLVRTSIFRPPKDRNGVQNHVILITDSPSTGSSDQIQDEVRLLKEDGVMFHTVGIGNASKAELKSVASDPDSKHLQILNSYSELLKMKKSAKKIFRAIPALRKKKKRKGKKKKTKKPKKSKLTTSRPTTSTVRSTSLITSTTPKVELSTTQSKVQSTVSVTESTKVQEKTTRLTTPLTTKAPTTSSEIITNITSTAEILTTTMPRTQRPEKTLATTSKQDTTERKGVTTKTTKEKLTTIPTTIGTPRATTQLPPATITNATTTAEKLTTRESRTQRPDKTTREKTLATTSKSDTSMTTKITEGQEKLTTIPTTSGTHKATALSTEKEETTEQVGKTIPTSVPTTRIPYTTRKVTTAHTAETATTERIQEITMMTTKIMELQTESTPLPTIIHTMKNITEKQTKVATQEPTDGITVKTITNITEKEGIEAQTTLSTRPHTVLTTGLYSAFSTISVQDTAVNLSACGSLRADIVLLLESTSNVNHARFLEFMDMLVEKLNIDSGDVQVALVTLSEQPYIEFFLGDYKSKADTLLAVRKAAFRRRKTNFPSALQNIREVVFGTGYGSRADASNIAILVTDGFYAGRRDVQQIKEQSKLNEKANINTFVLGVGTNNQKSLELLASRPHQRHMFYVNTPEKLTDTPGEIISHLCEAMVPVLSLADSEEADVVVAVHASRATSTRDFAKLKNYLKSLFARADVDSGKVQISCIVYGRNARTIFYLNQYNTAQQVSDAIDRISPRLRSDIVDSSAALVRAREMFGSGYGARATVPKALFMITDAPSTVKTTSVEAQKALLQSDGVDIFSIGVGVRDKSELELLSTSPNNIYNVQGYGQLAANADELRNRVYALNTAPAPPEIVTVLPQTPGPIEIITPSRETGTRVPPIRITFPSPTFDKMLQDEGHRFQECSSAKLDLVFVMDSSTSVSEQNFWKMKSFTRTMVSAADVDSGNVRVGLISYSDTAEVRFYLNTYSSKSEILEAINEMPYVYGRTNTADALRVMWSDVYTQIKGDRGDIPNTAIVVTDGVSNINQDRTQLEAANARATGIHIYAIGIGLSDLTELDGIATSPASRNRFTVVDFEELENLPGKVFKTICPGPLEYIPGTFQSVSLYKMV